jgi:hypothetical protein
MQKNSFEKLKFGKEELIACPQTWGRFFLGLSMDVVFTIDQG